MMQGRSHMGVHVLHTEIIGDALDLDVSNYTYN